MFHHFASALSSGEPISIVIPKSMSESNISAERTRLLKPSLFLYFVLGVAILACWAVAVLVYGSVVMLVLAIGGLACSLPLVGPIGEMLANKAIQKRYPPSIWFRVDVVGEQEMHSPLRAKTLFGHPLKKGKK